MTMVRSYLTKLNVKRECKTCTMTYDECDKCAKCSTNPTIIKQWQPNPTIAKKIVMHYMKQRSYLTAQEISAHMKVSIDIIKRAMAGLVKEGKLKIETSVVIVE